MRARTERRVQTRAAVAVHTTESWPSRLAFCQGGGRESLTPSSSSSFSCRAHLKTSILLCDGIVAPPDPRSVQEPALRSLPATASQFVPRFYRPLRQETEAIRRPKIPAFGGPGALAPIPGELEA
uniref:Uncharacterized protein n=1 Tax=Arundo donax TaxID=35708 RepID=A0A0A9FMV6_ARUDO